MTTLDTLALSSANAIHTSVSGVRAPVGGISGAAQTAALWRMAGYATAGAAAGAAVVFALIVAGPTVDDPSQIVVPTTNVVVPTTIANAVVTPTTGAPSPTEEPPPMAAVPGETGSESASEPEDIDPPMLELISPLDGDHLEVRIVTFSGRTEPGATVLASGKFPVVVDENGLWSVDLVLAPGANGVVFRATDSARNTSEIRLTVYFDVEEPEVEEPLATTTTTKAGEEPVTTTTAAVEWLFSANQKYGSCSEPVPFDVFNGRAKPGTIVTVSSPFGGGTTEVNDDGAWSRRVEFPSAPFNEQFLVTVTDHAGSQKVFTFISLFEG